MNSERLSVRTIDLALTGPSVADLLASNQNTVSVSFQDEGIEWFFRPSNVGDFVTETTTANLGEGSVLVRQDLIWFYFDLESTGARVVRFEP